MVMNRTFLKDTLREIRKSPGRFLAIVAIIALGTAFFVGIKTTSPDMKLTADRYFKAQGFMDFQLVSTAGFTDEDLLAIEKTEGVQLAVPTFSIDAVATVGENQKVLRIGSFAAENSIDRPLLVEGRLPETSGECAIEKNVLTNIDYHPGDRILLESGSKSSLADRLATDEFTVVGIINSPLYLSKERGSTTIGNGQVSAFMLIPEQDFLQKYYSGITIAAKDSVDVQAYTKAYDDRMAPLKSALETIAVQRAELRSQTLQVDSLPKVEWFVLDRNMNTGYVEYGSAADRMDAIAQVFPVLFILVAILICFASMSRMVEEQRQFMGTVKALGYSRTTIALKFLTYAVFASIIGEIIGLTVGFNLFPRTIFQAYSILYTVPKLILIFDIPFAMIAFSVGIGVTALSALLVCLGELGTSAATLMRPRAPKPGKVILLERIGPVWRRLSFIHKVTARNLFRYKSRFLMTVIGVCGCTALLLVGLGLSDVITTIGDKQFGELFTYQAAVGLENDILPEDRAALETAIRQQPDFESMQNRLSEPVEVAFQDTSKNVSLMVPENAGDMTRFINLRVRETNEPVPLGDDGVVLTEKLAVMLGVGIGGEIQLKIGDGPAVSAKVSGITENYLRHFIYMSPGLYIKLVHAAPVFNQVVVRLNDVNTETQQEFAQNIVSLSGAAAVVLTSDSYAMFNDMVQSIYSIVLILILSAALLSFIVLFSLTNININERMREIATIKILGFYDREVSSYIFRESLILTAIGTAFGLALGDPLARYAIGSAEVEMVMFGRRIFPLSFLIAAALTMAFAFSVNLVMIRRLKKIQMIEALKSME